MKCINLKLGFCLLIILFSSFSFSPSGVSAEQIKLVTGNDYRPFSDEGLPEKGLITSVVEHVFKEMGDSTQIDFLPWKRGYWEAKQGQYSGTFPYIKSPERLQEFNFSISLFDVIVRIFIKKDKPLNFNKYEDLIGLKNCAPVGWAIAKEVDELIQSGKIKKETPSELKYCFQMLALDRVDFIIVSEIIGKSAIMEMEKDQDKILMLPNELERIGQHLIVSKSLPAGEALLAKFNQTYKRLDKEGKIKPIIDRHLKSYFKSMN